MPSEQAKILADHVPFFLKSDDAKRRWLGLSDLVSEMEYKRKNTKIVVEAQEPTKVKAAILHASLIGLLGIICWTMVCAFPGNA